MSEAVTIQYDKYKLITSHDFMSALRLALTRELEPEQIQALLAEIDAVPVDESRRAA